jgi:membrane peptidoglycan carboxypeptidase
VSRSAPRPSQQRHHVRLSPRTRAAIAIRDLDRGRPKRLPVFRIALVLFLCAVVGLVSMGGVAAMAGASVIGSLAEGLPDPAALTSLDFDQPTVVYDRTGKVELARFERENRRVVTYDEVPKLLLDATTAAEDRTFWQNDGFDLGAIVAAAYQNVTGEAGTLERGASTITQQLVRARLLPPEVAQSNDRYKRKVMELLQASRLTAAFPGETGKEQIITAYLNQIYYGHQAFGIAAAAQIYFGVGDLSKLTLAQAALLAGLPKAPSTYDPYRYAVKDDQGRLVLPMDSPPVVRRAYVLYGMTTARWTHVSPDELRAALAEPVVLAGERPQKMRAAHFDWAVRDQLQQILGSADAIETGGYTVITTLDWNAQSLAEKYAYASAIIPNLPPKQAVAEMNRLKIKKVDRGWINQLRGKDLHNDAIVALDYRTGDVLAYVGSASYDRTDLASRRFQPQFDAAAAPRQPGSAFKPVVYSTAFDKRALTAGSVLLDISTDFGGWTPKDADHFERGPVRVRQALQQSLNLPAIRALERVGNPAVAETAARMDLNFLNGPKAFLQAGLAGAIGTVETKPIELTSAFGTFPNGGVHVPTRMILSITGPNGQTVYTAPEPQGTQAVSAQSAFLISDILNGNTDMHQNPIWASTLELRNGPGGSRRPAAVKTGTADAAADFGAYGFLAPPKNPKAPGLAVGIWMGNSDHSAPRTNNPPTSLLASGEVWHAFVREYTRQWPVADFRRPGGLVQERIDRWSGGKPGPWTHGTVNEWFIKGTEPNARHPVDEAGLLYSRACGTWMVDPAKAELGPNSWLDDVRAWTARARRGPGVKGPYGSTTAYFFGERSWGGPIIGACHKTSRQSHHGHKKKDHGPPPPPPAGPQPAEATATQPAPASAPQPSPTPEPITVPDAMTASDPTLISSPRTRRRQPMR